jgi:hypothetical protein
MGAECSAVGGFTLKMPKHLSDDPEDLLGKKKINFAHVGSYFTGDFELLLVLIPKPVDVDKQIADWVESVNVKLKLNFTIDDVKFTLDTLWH